MRKLVLAAVLAAAGLIGAAGRADAWGLGHTGPYAASAAFPCVNPPGWYTSTYSYAWYYPWYAYYNFSHGPYANWMAGGGFASYAGCGPNGMCGINGCGGGGGYGHPAAVMAGHAAGGPATPGTVTVNLPADAKLLFNGTAAAGAGATRTFTTPPLRPGTAYVYDLTAEVVHDGKVRQVTERVVVRAGEASNVTFAAR
jgi:uncharacterized protein (TIGR03000 family)